MKRIPVLLACVLASALPLSASETVRHFGQQLSVDNTDKISIDLPVGEAIITGWEQRRVEIDLLLKCQHRSDRCEDAAKAVHLVYRLAGGTLRVELKNWPKFGGKQLRVEARISVPRDLPLTADLGVGELSISGLEADVDGDLGVGQLTVHLPLAAFRAAHLDTGVGEASLLAGDRRIERGGLISREIDWTEGTGSARLQLDCGVGEIEAILK